MSLDQILETSNTSLIDKQSLDRGLRALHYSMLVLCTAGSTLLACGMLYTLVSFDKTPLFDTIDFGIRSTLLGLIACESYKDLQPSSQK